MAAHEFGTFPLICYTINLIILCPKQTRPLCSVAGHSYYWPDIRDDKSNEYRNSPTVIYDNYLQHCNYGDFLLMEYRSQSLQNCLINTHCLENLHALTDPFSDNKKAQERFCHRAIGQLSYDVSFHKTVLDFISLAFFLSLRKYSIKYEKFITGSVIKAIEALDVVLE